MNMFLTSEKRTTSEIRTEAVSPECPLFGGSTVVSQLLYNYKCINFFLAFIIKLSWE